VHTTDTQAHLLEVLGLDDLQVLYALHPSTTAGSPPHTAFESPSHEHNMFRSVPFGYLQASGREREPQLIPERICRDDIEMLWLEKWLRISDRNRTVASCCYNTCNALYPRCEHPIEGAQAWLHRSDAIAGSTLFSLPFWLSPTVLFSLSSQRSSWFLHVPACVPCIDTVPSG
jgi:hypothetical protein